MKQTVHRTLRFNSGFFSRSLKEVKEIILGWMDKYGENAKLDMFEDWDDTGLLRYTREETDGEYKERLEEEAKQAAAKKKKKSDIQHPDYEQYMILKRKFG